MKLTNETTGEIIELDEKTNDITELKNQLMLLGIKGLFYTSLARNIQKKIKRLETNQNNQNNKNEN